MRRALLVSLAVLALGGCGGNGGDGGRDPGSEAGGPTELHEVAADFSIRLPEEWRAVPSADALDDELAEFTEDNPEFETYLRSVVENDLIEFFAFDPETEGGFATNVNVIRFPVEGSPPFDEWSEGVIAEVEGLPTRVGDVEHSREELAAGEALRLEYDNTFRTEGDEVRVATLQYVFVVEGQGYVVTFSTLPEQEAEYEDVFSAAARSFSITA